MKKRKNLGGRPRFPKGEARTERVVAFLKPADLRTLEAIADERSVPVGQAARELLENALRRRPVPKPRVED